MSEAAPPKRRSLFSKPDFLRLWSAATVSLFGSQVTLIAIPFIAAVLLGASPGQVGLLAAVDFMPFLLFTLPAGVWVDRLSRRNILIAADIGRAVMLATIPIAFAFDALTIWQLYVVGFMNGVFTVFFDVADQSYLPTVLEKSELVDGNAKLQMSTSAAQLLGQPFGGGIVALLTAPIAIALDAVSFLASALLILGIRRPEATETSKVAPSTAITAADVPSTSITAEAEVVAADAAPAPRIEADKPAGMRAEIMSGLRYIGGNRYLRSIAATTSTSNLFGNIALATFAVYAYRELGLTPQLVGLIGGIGGAGVLVGALVASRVADRFGVGRAIIWPVAISGPFGLLVAIAPAGGAFPYIATAFFVGGIVNVIYNVNQVSLRQAITPQKFLGRMNATMRFLVWGTIPIGALIGAALSELIGVRTTVWIGSLLGLFPFLFVLLSPVRGLIRIPDADDEADGAVSASAA